MIKKFDNLKPTQKKITRKASDEKIDAVLNELELPTIRQKSIPFNVKLPENLYTALDQESKKTGLTKKAIVVAALWQKLDSISK